MPSDRRVLASHLTAAAAAAVLVVLAAGPARADSSGWLSGTRVTDASASSFAGWRGSPVRMVSGWIQWKGGWSEMYSYASGTQPRSLKQQGGGNVVFAHALFPGGSTLSACAAGSYDDEQREVARRLNVNGAGDARIRLGWEANGDWFPWSAAGKPADQWKACFTRIARAMLSAAPNLKIEWSMGKKGRIDVRTIYPDDAPISGISLSHYDDAYDRFGNETYLGGPWGLRAWCAFAASKGKTLGLGEWGVGRAGDNPQYIQDMHDFLHECGGRVTYEAYFNNGQYRLYPVGNLPNSRARYQQLF
jgi:hypothetical protein